MDLIPTKEGDPKMPNIASIIRDHVALSIRCVDRLYVNGYLPLLSPPCRPPSKTSTETLPQTFACVLHFAAERRSLALLRNRSVRG